MRSRGCFYIECVCFFVFLWAKCKRQFSVPFLSGSCFRVDHMCVFLSSWFEQINDDEVTECRVVDEELFACCRRVPTTHACCPTRLWVSSSLIRWWTKPFLPSAVNHYSFCPASSTYLTIHQSPTHSFIPRLQPSFSANPYHRSLSFRLQGWLHGFHGLFTDPSEHTRFFSF